MKSTLMRSWEVLRTRVLPGLLLTAGLALVLMVVHMHSPAAGFFRDGLWEQALGPVLTGRAAFVPVREGGRPDVHPGRTRPAGPDRLDRAGSLPRGPEELIAAVAAPEEAAGFGADSGARSFEAIDYSDPAGGGLVPLIKVVGKEEHFLSPHFKVKDLAARDGAPYARISSALVDLLERLRVHLGVPIYITSGYRHPALNAEAEVGGATRSQHMAGRAADLSSAEKTPLELAAAALDVTGCRVGLGLGSDFIHLDLRGALAAWVAPDAAMGEAEFDAWVSGHCSGKSSTEPGVSSASAAKPAPEVPSFEAYRDEMTALARVQLRKGQQGAVVLDLRKNVEGRDETFEYQLSFLPLAHPDAEQLGIGRMVRRLQQSRYFVFLVLGAEREPYIGVMNHAGPEFSAHGAITTGL